MLNGALYRALSNRLRVRDDAGLVVVDSEMTNQEGESVFAGDMKFLFRTKDTGDAPAE